MARSSSRRSPAPTALSAPGARTAPDASRALPRVWQGIEYRPLQDLAPAWELFEFAAVAFPATTGPGMALGALADGVRLVGAVVIEEGGGAALLHGPVVGGAGAREAVDPMEVAAQLASAAIDHVGARGIKTVFARPQGLDRIWVRFGFIPVPEVSLPDALRGQPGAGLFAYRGGSALWSPRAARDVEEQAER